MPFVFAMACTVPANTPEAAAVRDDRDLPPGSVVDQVKLHVPAGHQAKVPVWLEKDESKLLPTDGGTLRLDNVSALDLLVSPVRFRNSARFSLVAYNEDTVDPHTVRAVVLGRYAHEVPPEEADRMDER